MITIDNTIPEPEATFLQQMLHDNIGHVPERIVVEGSHELEKKNCRVILLRTLMNDVRRINKHLQYFNASQTQGDFLIGRFETYTDRRSRIRAYRLPILKWIVLVYEFVLLRVLPKIRGLNRIYFFLTGGKDRLLSKAEMLGRCVCCGYSILDYRKFEGLSYFLLKKVNEPSHDLHPSYGPIFGMWRVGKNGKMFRVYKFRTMHPFSEYLHDYVLKLSGYSSSGKPAADFRLTPWGRVLRKYWIDELPQIVNVLKGEMKLVGVRPVSPRYLEDISTELKALRLAQKPGCIPPYVALNRKGDVQSVQQAEMEYLKEWNRRPYITDVRYFFRAVFNILFRQKRSA